MLHPVLIHSYVQQQLSHDGLSVGIPRLPMGFFDVGYGPRLRGIGIVNEDRDYTHPFPLLPVQCTEF